MRVVKTIEDLNDALAGQQSAFVPTMGALHPGHCELIRAAADKSKDKGLRVVVSIFVNPTQFGPGEDFQKYPRQLEADVAKAAQAGAQAIFAPLVETMYPSAEAAPVPPLPDVATKPQLEDAVRPTHFSGVCQVVARLFDLVNPAFAVFGEKDFQQLRVIEEMVVQHRQRWPEMQIVRHPTVREPDGLAMSSRNVYLKPTERDRALGLFRALRNCQTARSSAQAESIMLAVLDEHELQVDYAVVRDANTLLTPSPGLSTRALIAARLGKVRLIDNMQLPPTVVS